jgi:hypothetical protein
VLPHVCLSPYLDLIGSAYIFAFFWCSFPCGSLQSLLLFLTHFLHLFMQDFATLSCCSCVNRTHHDMAFLLLFNFFFCVQTLTQRVATRHTTSTLTTTAVEAVETKGLQAVHKSSSQRAPLGPSQVLAGDGRPALSLRSHECFSSAGRRRLWRGTTCLAS